MEFEVNVRCRKSDHHLVKEVRYFGNKDVPIELNLDEGRYLPEFEEKEGPESCMGGVVMHTKKARIVCSNTLDSRLALVYQEAIPDIRANLFNFVKNTPATINKANENVAETKPHH